MTADGGTRHDRWFMIPPVLIAVIAANVAVFIAMGAATGRWSWQARTLEGWGGNFGILSLHGQSWRLLTSQYLHANLIHIGGNMVLLAIAGGYVADKVGASRFLVTYTLCGLLAALASAVLHPLVVGVGASGAIAGVVGIVVALWASGRCPDINGNWVAQTVGINAVYSLVPQVDWVAHLAGFVAGMACGAALLAGSWVRPVAPEL